MGSTEQDQQLDHDALLEEYFSNLDKQQLLSHADSVRRQYETKLRESILIDGDIELFSEEVLGYQIEPHHKEILKFQELSKQEISLLLAFRGCGKSTIGTIIRAIIELIRNPNTRILIVSKTQLQAEIFLREIKQQLQSNETFRTIFGDYVGSKWDNKEITISKRTSIQLKESSISCIGVGGPTASRHYEVILCCHPETLVMTRRGALPIKDLEANMSGIKVLGHDGKYHKILKIYKREYKGPLYGIRPFKSCKTTWVTPNHPVLVYRYDDLGLPRAQFIPAQDIRMDDKLPYPRVEHNSPHRISQNEDINRLLKIKKFWRFLGYWYAEGSIDPGYRRMRLTFGTNEEEQKYIADCLDCIEAVFDKRPSPILSNNGTITQISLNDSRLEFLRDCGRLQPDRYLPYWLKQATWPNFKEFLLGYWRGDGNVLTFGNKVQRIGLTSVSLPLLLDIRQVLLDFGVSTSVSKAKDSNPNAVVCGNIVSAKSIYVLTGDASLADCISDTYGNSVDTEFYQPSTYHFDEKYVYSGIRKIEVKEYSGLVYNLEVADAHTYCHDLVTSHNCDDIVDEENSRTELQRERLKIWFFKSLLPTLEPGGRVYMSGTRWHPEDLYGYIARAMKLRPLIIPAIRTDGKSQWPDKFPLEYLTQLRDSMGVPIFETQYQMNTSAMEGKIFSFDGFHWYEYLPANVVYYQGVDLAIGKKSQNDYFAHCTIAVDYTSQPVRRYVVDIYRSRIGFNQQTETIVKRFFKYDPIKVGIESNAYQVSQTDMAEEILGKRRVVPVYTLKDKVTRAMKLAAQIESGEVLFKKEQMNLVQELLEMPDGTHDDMFDALDIAVTTSKTGLKKVRANEPGVL